ncbi:hypothetical protein N7492_008084 [Penicillium capsulatum]|uniref:Uncharacterized protein n=1 Tax=Penicillium capsulatum TaxID=69766 RepID=A0A9W9HQ33_9EURO|nr:hypothetical protein N7492_008084 [Penicillium capsulatum]KAJ6105494.1 hypothetical protein N7512_009011 [Penicillium capsulatum]
MASVTCGDLLGGAPALPWDNKLPLVTELKEPCLSSASSEPSEPSEPDMDRRRIKRIDPPTAPGSPTRPGARTTSRPSSAATSVHHSRSNSHSTARSRPPSRHSSLHSSRRAITTASIVPVPPPRVTPHERRESLLALHRESCRLFNDPEPSAIAFEEARPSSSLQRSASSYRSHHGRTSSETGGSAPPSPVVSSHSSYRFEPEHRASLSLGTRPSLQTRDRSHTMPTGAVSHAHGRSSSSIHVPTTVMEWTSPSTRRQEYEKIDRASRGVRGLWRRVAPRWCQASDTRTPFFEEGRTSREGSVRRFRMDLPDEEDTRGKPQVQLLDFLVKGNPAGNPRRLWSGRRSKTCH